MKTELESQGINFIIAGNVRAQEERNRNWNVKRVFFKEKGVDVKIVVDMISIACDKEYEYIVLCS